MNLSFRALKRQFKTAPVTFFLLAILIGLFLVQILVDNRSLDTPYHGSFLAHWGANISGLTASGEWWRLFTSMFLHGGFLHVLFNSASLYELGKEIEPRLGSWRFALLYIASGLGGAVASMLWHDNVLSVGASGAIFGLFGAAFLFAWKKPVLFDRFDPKLMLGFIVVSILLGWWLNYDNAAHLGGLAAGLYLSCSLLGPERRDAGRWQTRGFFLGIGALAAVLWLLCYRVYDPGRALRVEVAQLSQAMDFTLGSERSRLSACAYHKLENFDGETGGLSQRLRGCAGDAGSRRLLQVWVNNQWPRCFGATRRLSRRLQDARELKAVQVIREYCEAQRYLDRLMLGREDYRHGEEELKAAIDQYSWMISGLSYYRAGAQPDSEERLGYALYTLLRKEDAEARRLGSLDSCPKLSCYRPWVQALINRND